MARLAHGGQRNSRGGGELDVVIADDRDIVRYVKALPDHLLEQAQSQQVVAAERGCRPPLHRKAAEPFAGPTSRRDSHRRRGDGDKRVGVTPGARKRITGTLEPVSDLRDRRRSAYEGDPLVSHLQEMTQGETPATDVIDRDRAHPRALRATVEENDRHTTFD